MKKCILIFILFSIVHQTLLSQTKDANTQTKPLTLGRQWQQDYAQTIRGYVEENKGNDCNNAMPIILQIIADFNASTDNNRKKNLLRRVRYSCPLTIQFLDSIVQNDTSEVMRCAAISCLGGIDAQSSIPFLLSRANNPTVSMYEKMQIGSALVIIYDTINGQTILNQNCFSIEKRFCDICIWSYYILGNESSKNYYRYVISHSNDSTAIICCAQRLAELGDAETAFPVLEQVINSNAKDGKIGSMRALRCIGDEKSIRLIKKMQQDANPIVQKEAKNTLKSMGIKTKENINE